MRKQIDVEIYTTDASHSIVGRLSNVELKSADYKGLKIKRFPYFLKLGYFFRFSPILLIRLFFSSFDVIHIHNSHDAHLLGAIIIKVLRRKRLILTGHNPFIVGNEKRGDNLNSNVKFFDKVLKLFTRSVDGYVALLDSEKNFVSNYLGIPLENIKIIPNGINDIYFKGLSAQNEISGLEQDFGINRSNWDLIVGTVSRINFVKGIQNLEKAVKDNPKVLFVFAGGDGGYLLELKKLFRDSKNVILNGEYISKDKTKTFFNMIDLFLLPSIYEPFGITLVEALTQGKYVLSTNVGGPTEILNSETGELISPNDQNKWSERISYFANNKEILSKNSAKAIELSKKYEWSNIIERLISLYKNEKTV